MARGAQYIAIHGYGAGWQSMRVPSDLKPAGYALHVVLSPVAMDLNQLVIGLSRLLYRSMSNDNRVENIRQAKPRMTHAEVSSLKQDVPNL